MLRYSLALMTTVLVCWPVRAQETIPPVLTPQERLTKQLNYNRPLYMDADVRRALNLRDEQISRLNIVNERLQTRYQADYNRLMQQRRDDAQARRDEEARETIMRTYNTELLRATNDILTPEQAARYRQLMVQYEGPAAFADPDLRRRFNINENQARLFNELNTEGQREAARIITEARNKPDDGINLYINYRRRQEERMRAIMNEEQRRQWLESTGETFQFKPDLRNQGR